MSDTELPEARVRRAIPVPVDIAGQWAWRLLAVAAVLAVVFYLIATFKEIVVAFLVAMLISALLVPFVSFLSRHRWPRWLAIVVSLVATFAILGALVLLVETQVRAGLPSLETQSVQAYNSFKAFLKTSPLQVDDSQFDGYLNQIGSAVSSHSSQLFSGALTVGSSALHILTGALLTLFATIFILIDGAGVWMFVTRLFPRRARTAIDGAGHAGWLTLTTFVRVQLLVATVDAVGVGLFAFFLGLPLAIPIAIIVFLASFIPVVGAIATGIIAVAVALVFVGPVQALIMLGGVLLVHLLEAHVLQPLVMGSAVKVHPLAVVFAVAAGTLLAGIPGALFAVPTIAVLNVMVNFIASGRWRKIESEPAA
ncbi:AI-2E family transporter [Subtercola endophyticus]|uniref:AI-2E family transporter n=1 Tax=Subtercola endophyticus TaxID=2895559 RepID=UPI001E652512|nr:AI-2E family transporter [Subtercola endophyticus]UFS57567.1 AI-2E family transporter [Subtercola endophyticus]